MKKKTTGPLIMLTGLLILGCNIKGEHQAQKLCAKANALAKLHPRQALLIQRRIWETLPTAGTRNAQKCLAGLLPKMMIVRQQVYFDRQGSAKVIDNCGWFAQVAEVFQGSTKLPYPQKRANKLAKDCLRSVGRAWSRAPDNQHLMQLHTRFKKILADG